MHAVVPFVVIVDRLSHKAYTEVQSHATRRMAVSAVEHDAVDSQTIGYVCSCDPSDEECISSTIHTPTKSDSTDCCCGRIADPRAVVGRISKGPFAVLPLYRLSSGGDGMLLREAQISCRS